MLKTLRTYKGLAAAWDNSEGPSQIRSALWDLLIPLLDCITAQLFFLPDSASFSPSLTGGVPRALTSKSSVGKTPSPGSVLQRPQPATLSPGLESWWPAPPLLGHPHFTKYSWQKDRGWDFGTPHFAVSDSYCTCKPFSRYLHGGEQG